MSVACGIRGEADRAAQRPGVVARPRLVSQTPPLVYRQAHPSGKREDRVANPEGGHSSRSRVIMDRPRTQFKSVTRDAPCPLCKGVEGCSIGDDGLILCRHREGTQAGFVCLGKAKGDSQWVQYRRENDPLLEKIHRPRPSPSSDRQKPTCGWRPKSQEFPHNL